MATLVFSALGTLIGGPLGGAIGALVGQQVDHAIIGSGTREGPKLKELAVTTSSYGTAVPRIFGTMRVPGTIIWATDLVEHRDKSGGKGKPSVVSYSYSASFAVALSSRALSGEGAGIGRIWADGNLLRGSGGDLKAAGAMRFYPGTAHQDIDPLIAAAEGVAGCPAYRGMAYVVFEDLQLGDFGNRIPTLSFEVMAGDSELELADLVDGIIDEVSAAVPLIGIVGLSCDGPVIDLLSGLDPAIPFDCDVSGDTLVLGRQESGLPARLGEATASAADDAFGSQFGFSRKRLPPPASAPEVIRYYDVERDFQIGLQRAPGKPAAGQPQSLELPAALYAADARRIAADVARRSSWARQSLSWRTAELDPAIGPGKLVVVPDCPGIWRVNDWEWREAGVEMTLWRAVAAASTVPVADPGRFNAPADNSNGPTILRAFELPWDGTGSGQSPHLFAATSSPAGGWNGAALYADEGDGQLVALGSASRLRAIVGVVADPLGSGSSLLFDRQSAIVVDLASTDLELIPATVEQLARGANRALIGSEIIQFAAASALGNGRWLLTGLLRGRGGTESAIAGHAPGESFVLIDGNMTALDPNLVGSGVTTVIAAIGLADLDPVRSEIACRGLSLRPLSPVHPRIATDPSGDLQMSWIRRARGAWSWLDGVDVPLGEQAEEYVVTLGDVEVPIATWSVIAPALILPAATLTQLRPAGIGAAFQVRQRGSYALSEGLLLTHLTA